MTAPPRVIATEAALQALQCLQADRGRVIIFQSGGCRDSSSPLCFLAGQRAVGPGDVLLGEIAGCPICIDRRQFEVLRHSQLVLDVTSGDPEGFSLPAGDDMHFVTRGRLFSPDEEGTPAVLEGSRDVAAASARAATASSDS